MKFVKISLHENSAIIPSHTSGLAIAVIAQALFTLHQPI